VIFNLIFLIFNFKKKTFLIGFATPEILKTAKFRCAFKENFQKQFKKFLIEKKLLVF